MLSEALPQRRRSRSVFEDEEGDSDAVNGRTPGSTPPKRPRGHEVDDDSEDEAEEPQTLPNGLGERGENGFQPGAIVRVKLNNFVTYEKAEFHPGPNLNMVIGPNGTGKSSLVCAICLGLGWPPSVLGRATKIGEFVKHGMDDAFIEVELQKRSKDPENPVVRLRIIRDGDQREWWLNDRKTNLKHIQKLTNSFSIQIDNLCQFLPQDKVSEFAALSPVELLQQTQRAAAPPQMLEWHEELKKLRKDQKAFQEQVETDKETLANLETRQEGLRAEVARLEERQQIEEKVALLQKSVPFVEYRVARLKHIDYKEKKVAAQRRLRELEAQVEPTMRSVNAKQDYYGKILQVVEERKDRIRRVERKAGGIIETVEKLDDSIKDMENDRNTELEKDKKRKATKIQIQRKIVTLKANLQNAPPEFDAAAWNDRIREKEHEARQKNGEIQGLQASYEEFVTRATHTANQLKEAKVELESFDSQAGQQLAKVRAVSAETAQAWAWIEKHQSEFEKEICGPPIISCSVKDRRYVDQIESVLQRSDLICITAQTRADVKKLTDQLCGTMGLADVTIRGSSGSLSEHSRPTSNEDLRRCGLDGWALDFIEGPEPVLTMLCDSQRINMIGVGLKDISEEQYQLNLQRKCNPNMWVAGRQYYRVSTRPEYGPSAVSTMTRTTRPAKYWSDRPVDVSARRQIEERISNLKREYDEYKGQAKPFHDKKVSLEEEKEKLNKEANELKEQKADEQRARGAWEAIPDQIASEEDVLEQNERAALEIRQAVKKISIQHDHAVLRKSKYAMDLKEVVDELRQAHEELLEAEVRGIEAKSDVDSLIVHNQGIARQLEEERALVKEAEQISEQAKKEARERLKLCQEIQAQCDRETTEYFANLDPALTVETLQQDISAEQAKLEFIHAGNPNAIRDFERRQVDIDKLTEKIKQMGKRLEKLASEITRIRSEWEPELDQLITQISDAFSYNFEQIGCAGEVGIHKDEDFDLWSIEIKVKFRENETLQLLDAHRQSGGERSVSTIFYLMALQALARAPFRVVDEINQGMDPRNERMVHERMVEIACKEHTSQYFLITPKLLTGLRYDKRMRVLCIASGEYMPEDYRKLDVRKILSIRKAMVAAR
ncbi:P-loop containing nucleoside triphosphate hydrolase protein [Xylogone sp. PMI_703]|nr:P-loop containing nucleoside triphosphate hydrolase protein [Xylogone sp. PMI_703]